MPKPNLSWTLPQMKEFVRSHNLNKGNFKLSVSKPQMIQQLKDARQWDYKFDTHGKPSLMKRTAVQQLRDYRRRHGGGKEAQKSIDKEVVRRGGGGGKVPL